MTTMHDVPGFRSGEVRIGETWMHYLDAGSGPPVLFVHGNPTSSFLWRDVLVRLTGQGRRLIAVDLIGMGASGKLDLDYRLADHIRFLDLFVEALDLRDLTLVGHDWGVALSLNQLWRHPGRVRAIAVMEGHLRPLPGWEAFDEGGRELFRRLRQPGTGEQLVLEENFFIETLLPAGMHRRLTPHERAVYATPYPSPASRRPLLQWAREIPVAGEPADVVRLLTQAMDHLAAAPIPKLLVHGRPGAVIGPDAVAWCRRRVPDLAVAAVGQASHFLPEDRPAEVADALCRWWNGHLRPSA